MTKKRLKKSKPDPNIKKQKNNAGKGKIDRGKEKRKRKEIRDTGRRSDG